jgi:hypothetical protein
MSSFLGLSASNWMIWIIMAVFIVAYFILTEALNKKEDE